MVGKAIEEVNKVDLMMEVQAYVHILKAMGM